MWYSVALLTCTRIKINSYLICVDVQQIKDRVITQFVFGTFGTAPQRIDTYNFILLTAAGGELVKLLILSALLIFC